MSQEYPDVFAVTVTHENYAISFLTHNGTRAALDTKVLDTANMKANYHPGIEEGSGAVRLLEKPRPGHGHHLVGLYAGAPEIVIKLTRGYVESIKRRLEEKQVYTVKTF